jgi:type I restriction enzyme S subunit
MNDWKKVKLSKVLKQYRIEHWVQDGKVYKQVSILNDGSVVLRGDKYGREIGRKRQFIVNTDKYPNTLIFTRQLLLQGSIGLAGKDVNKCIVTENMPMFSIEGIEPDYLHVFLSSDAFKEQVGALETTGSAQKSIHERQFLELEIPLPSVTEQKELVKKFKRKKESFSSITSELTTQQTLITQLRQSILQEAVHGKLPLLSGEGWGEVAGRPHPSPLPKGEGENASELLKRIKAEKEKLIKQGNLKKEKTLPPISENEIPYPLPKGWVWCRLGDLCSKIGSGSTPRGGRDVYTKDGTIFLRSQNVHDEGLDLSNVAYIDDATHKKMSSTKVIANDILLNITGGSIGRCALIPNDFIDANVSQHVTIIRLIALLNHPFIHNYILSPYFQDKIMEVQTGGNREGLAKKNMQLMLVPLPPLPEQKRIVEKVNQLMQHCNELEQQVQQSISYAQQLMQAVLREVFEGKEKKYTVTEQRLRMVAEK